MADRPLGAADVAAADPPRGAASFLRGSHTDASITARIADLVLVRPNRPGGLTAFGIAAAAALLFVAATIYLIARGVGIWGIDMPIVWGFAITNYVWWIANAMGGTFISAALLLLRQPWRTSINRLAESLTLFSLSIAGLFPILHLGRPWFFYWLAPYPGPPPVWPQWRSALVWDFFAILAYVVFSILFWYVGLLPDFASLRDRARRRSAQVLYGLLALGWRGDAVHWQRHELVSRLLAGLGVPLVFSVHSMVALDFSEGITRGWHSTIFGPFFVAGALFSGFAVVLAVAVPLRAFFKLHDYITALHLDNLAKGLLAAGLIVDYSYAMEIFTSFYSGDRYEIFTTLNRFTGPYAPVFWSTIACNVLAIQALWFRAVRRNAAALMAVSLCVIVGMWLERFMLIVTSLERTFLPSAWGMFYPTAWDWIHLIGSIGVFMTLLFLFVRLVPVMAISELRTLLRRRTREAA